MTSSSYDIAVIGGGPAGMMAAGRAAELGAKVVLLEKNAGLGKKLLITGGGRCNILNAEFDTHKLVDRYGKKGKSLFSAFSQLDAQATWDFFEGHGLPLKIEAEKRAFPASEKAESVHRTMLEYLRAGKVEVRTGCSVQGFETQNNQITGIKTPTGLVTAKSYILATGGKSHPETGSTGDGFRWTKELGHTVVDTDPALVPIALKDKWLPDVSGISEKGVKLSILQNGKNLESNTGKMLFTHVGISGPLVLNMSKKIGEYLKLGAVTLSLDLFPTMDIGSLDAHLLSIFEKAKNKMIKNNIGEVVQPRLGHVLLGLTTIDPETPLNKLSREDRLAFARLLKDIPLHVSHVLGTDKAVVTGGGVDLKEIDFKTMRSKHFKNLFIAGDLLDFDRPSGGFSLQICWTTGFIAGTHAAA